MASQLQTPLGLEAGTSRLHQGFVNVQFEKYFRSRLTQITSRTPAVPPHSRGVSRSSRTRGGMRWTRQRWAREAMAGRVDKACERSLDALTRDVAADGEVVWS